MNELEKYINNFMLTGKLSNNFDEFGNINLYISASKPEETFICYELLTENYDNEKIKEFYDIVISKDNNSTIVSEIDQDALYAESIVENEKLKEKLNNLIITATDGKSENEIVNEKSLIINLRIQLDQGDSPSDFEDTFPYNPKLT